MSIVKAVKRAIRANSAVYKLATGIYVELENRQRRVRHRRMMHPQFQTVRRELAPRRGRARNGRPHILFISIRGLINHQLMDGVLAHALNRRGAKCTFFTCGGGLSLCDFTPDYIGLTPTHCQYCRECSVNSIESFGNPRPLMLKDLLSESELRAWSEREAEIGDDPANYVYGGVPVGQMVGISIRYILAVDRLPETEEVLSYHRRMVVSACMLVDAYRKLYARTRPDRIFLFSGLFFPEQVARYVAAESGIPITTYEAGHRYATLMMAHDEPSPWMNIGPHWPRISQEPMEPADEKELDDYLAARWKGAAGIEFLWPTMVSDQKQIRERLNLPEGTTVVTAFTNMLWDSAISDRHRAFPSMLDWLRQTIQYFATERPDDILVIRVHPAEVRLDRPTSEKVADILAADGIPANVRVVRPEEDIDSYQLARLSSLGLIYTSTIGLELPLMGLTAVVVGETHYRDKGFTLDCSTAEEYFACLAPGCAPRHVTAEQRELARRYTHAFIFRYHVYFPYVTTLPNAKAGLQIEQPQLLEPGADPELDLICQAILEGRDVLELRAARRSAAPAALAGAPVAVGV